MRPARLTSRPAAGVRRAVVHHDAVTPPTEHARCAAQVRRHDAYHRNGNGWACIGYHRLVCAHGTVYEGRPLLAVGAHSQPANVDGVGYCLFGAGDDEATPAQLSALAAAIAEDSRTLGRQLVVTHHRAVEPGTTSCPGDGIAEQLDDVRGRVAAASRSSRPAAVPAQRTGPTVTRASAAMRRPTLQLGDRGPHVAHAQRLLRVTVDGHYGARTLAAVRALQTSQRLDVDGLVGPRTWNALHSLAVIV